MDRAGPCSRDLLISFWIGVKATVLILKGNAFHKYRLAFCLLKLGVFNRINNIFIAPEHQLAEFYYVSQPEMSVSVQVARSAIILPPAVQ